MKNRTLLFTAACLSMLMFGAACVATGTINSYLTQTFAADKIFIGFLASLFAGGALVGSLTFGPVVDRYGYKVLMSVSLFVLFVVFLSIGKTSNLLIIRILFFILGLSGGIINGAANALVSDINDENKGAYLSYLGIFWGVGAITLPSLTSFLLQNNVGYSAILTVIGIISLVPMLFFLVLKSPEARQRQGFPVKKAFELMQNPLILLIGFFLFLESGIENLTSTWFPKFFEETYGIETQKALISITYAGVILVGFGAAAAFPAMMGYVGTFFPEMAGTALSIVLFLALAGNALISGLAGIIFEKSGIESFSVLLGSIVLVQLVLLAFFIRKSGRIKTVNNQ